MGKESAALPKRPRTAHHTACTACRTSPRGSTFRSRLNLLSGRLSMNPQCTRMMGRFILPCHAVLHGRVLGRGQGYPAPGSPWRRFITTERA